MLLQVITTEEFLDWLSNLKNVRARQQISRHIERFELENKLFGDIKAVQGGLYELRFHFGSGYRVYFKTYGNLVVLITYGGDKASQSRDINRAINIMKKWESENIG